MKTIFLIINAFLISFISCSYYSKNLVRNHHNTINNITDPNKIKLLQENSTEVLIKPKENISSETEKITVIQLNNRHDVQYYGDIYIGIPKKK